MFLILSLNERLQPIHRFEFEDALQEILDKGIADISGEVCGGGTVQEPDGEITSCEIEIELEDDTPEAVETFVRLVNSMGISKGSALLIEEQEIPVGTLEGLGIYLNGTDLPAEVYQSCDVNYVIEQLEQAMNTVGSMYSYWESNTYTALYFYGSSFDEMKEKIIPFISSYPLCQKCQIEQIA